MDPVGLGLAVGGPAAAAAGYWGVGLSVTRPVRTFVRRSVVWRANTDRRAVALTFDDGPDPRYTPRFLEALDGNGATFFVLGVSVRRWPSVVQDAARAGHEIACHGETHRSLAGLGPRATVRSLVSARAAIEEAIGTPPRFFRPPYGVFNLAGWVEAPRLGMSRTLWTAWARDWEERATSESIAGRILARAAPGAILLLHDADGSSGAPERTLAALSAILEGLRDMGLEALTLSELVDGQSRSPVPLPAPSEAPSGIGLDAATARAQTSMPAGRSSPSSRGPRGGQLRPISPQDAFFLHTETHSVQQHVAGVAILDLSTASGGSIDLETLQRSVERRLGELPRLRQRLAFPPLELGRPLWVDDVDFAIDNHIRTRQLPPPGGMDGLARLVEEILAAPLDRNRPLWDLTLVPGLEGGRAAVLLRLHHAMADGLGAMHVVAKLFDRTPDPVIQEPSPWHPASTPSRSTIFSDSLGEQLLEPLRSTGAALRRALAEPAGAWSSAHDIAVGVWQLARKGPAGPSFLNKPFGPERRISLFEAPRSAFQQVRSRQGGSVNEILLALAAEGLHRLYEVRGEPSAGRTLRAAVPVSIRIRDHEGDLGNQTSGLQIDLPIGPMTPESRLRAVREIVASGRASPQAVGARFVMAAVGAVAPARLHRLASRSMYCGRWFNLIVSDIPGPIVPLYLAGGAVITAYPIIPLAERVSLGIAAMSWTGKITFGLTAAREVVPDVEVLAEAMQRAIVELLSSRSP